MAKLSVEKVKAEAAKYLNTPKAERRAKGLFKKIAETQPEVAHEIRKVLEGRRGFRKINGVIEFTDSELVNQIDRLKEKKQAWEERGPQIDERIADLEAELESRQDGATSTPSKGGKKAKKK